MKFYLDEHVDPALGDLLDQEGFSVFYASEEGLGRSDRFHLQNALENGACMVTRDDDFLKLISETEESPGVFYLTGFQAPEKTFEKLSRYFDEDLGEGFVIYI